MVAALLAVPIPIETVSGEVGQGRAVAAIDDQPNSVGPSNPSQWSQEHRTGGWIINDRPDANRAIVTRAEEPVFTGVGQGVLTGFLGVRGNQSLVEGQPKERSV